MKECIHYYYYCCSEWTSANPICMLCFLQNQQKATPLTTKVTTTAMGLFFEWVCVHTHVHAVGRRKKFQWKSAYRWSQCSLSPLTPCLKHSSIIVHFPKFHSKNTLSERWYGDVLWVIPPQLLSHSGDVVDGKKWTKESKRYYLEACLWVNIKEIWVIYVVCFIVDAPKSILCWDILLFTKYQIDLSNHDVDESSSFCKIQNEYQLFMTFYAMTLLVKKTKV